MDSKSNSSLCFNKDEFSKIDFSVDKFVSECRKHASLEEMREDLGIYHKILCSAMIELINKDYADFVNLSSNLVGLDKSLKSLSTPLQSLKDEVNHAKSGLELTLQSAKNQFSEKVNAYKSKASLHHILYVFETLDKTEDLSDLDGKSEALQLEILERVAASFNVLQFHLAKVENFECIKSKKEAVEALSRTIEQHLEKIFVKGVQSNNINSLQKVLQVYAVIGKEKKIESFFQNRFAKPYMNKVITQLNLTKHGLGNIYVDILSFVNTNCSGILAVTKGTRSTEMLPHYDFLLNAVWPEVMDCFEHIAPVYLNSPGDPRRFHQNYTASIKFLKDFEQCCQVKSSVRRLREDASYNNFLTKWNLDLYFQIQFQEIASEFEKSLTVLSIEENSTNDNPYVLSSSLALFSSLRQCWSDDVYLPPLKGSFWRLSLQILARFVSWTSSILKEENPMYLARTVKDVTLLTGNIRALFDDTVYLNIGKENINTTITGAIDESIASLSNISNVASSVIVDAITNRCLVHLRQVNDIPRLYRRTNRELPTRESGYVSLVFRPLEEFLNDTKLVLPEKWGKQCHLEISKKVLLHCFSLMNDVLTSIKKMGESLKILKRAREKPTGQVLDGGVTDDDKIRRQLAIDVLKLEEIVLKLGLRANDVGTLKELKDLVTAADKHSLKS